MQHRELYRSIVPEDVYIITYSDLASCSTCASARRIARDIYYKLEDSQSSEAQRRGTEVHQLKEQELSHLWQNEMRLSYKMSDGYYLCGTIDRFYLVDKIVEDFKHTTSEASAYLETKQIETYAFLLMQNGGVVQQGRYTTLDKDGNILTSEQFDLPVDKLAFIYSSFILPRFNMIKKEIEELKNQYVGAIDRTAKSIFSE